MTDLLCAECIANQSMTRNEPKSVEAIIDGTGLCRGHAQRRMEDIVASRKAGAAPTFAQKMEEVHRLHPGGPTD